MKISAVKKLFVGSPLATAPAKHERLSEVPALAVLSSDTVSSLAPEETLINGALLFRKGGVVVVGVPFNLR